MPGDKIEELVNKTFILSKDYKHHYVTLEHLMAIILDTDEVADILNECGVDPKECSREIYDHLEQEVEKYADGQEKEPKKTVMLERVFHLSLIHI